VNVEIDCREEGTLLELQLFVDRPHLVTEVDGLISNPRFIEIIHLSVLELCVLERTLRFNHSNATGIDIN
jgi:hypothetical protein